MAVVNFNYWSGYRFRSETVSDTSDTVLSPIFYTFRTDIFLIAHVGDEASITPLIKDEESQELNFVFMGYRDSGVIKPFSITFPTSSDIVVFPVSSFLSFEKMRLSVSTSGSCEIWIKPDSPRA